MQRSALTPLVLPALALGLILALMPASAEAFRCNNRLVSTGDLTAEVKDKCGSPPPGSAGAGMVV